MRFDNFEIIVNCEEMSRKYVITPVKADSGSLFEYLFKITYNGDFCSLESSLEDCIIWCEADAMNGGCKFE